MKHLLEVTEEAERKQMDADPLDRLHKARTERLENLYEMTAEENGSLYRQSENPELKAVELFLANA